jgi:hypothetical protein
MCREEDVDVEIFRLNEDRELASEPERQSKSPAQLSVR